MLKVGDKVNVSNFRSGTNYKNGTIIHIDSNDCPLPYLVIVKSNRQIWCSSNDLELIPPTPKELLEVGMVIQLANDSLMIVCKNSNNNLVLNSSSGGYIAVNRYDEQLKNTTSETYNINKIYSLCNREYDLNEISTRDRYLLWERKPEYYNGKIVCIKSENPYFTKGKIYEVKDGVVFGNNHEPFLDESKAKTIDDVNSSLIFLNSSSLLRINMDELKEKLFQLERQLLELEMKDHWDNADFDLASELRKEIKNVREEMKQWG